MSERSVWLVSWNWHVFRLISCCLKWASVFAQRNSEDRLLPQNSWSGAMSGVHNSVYRNIWGDTNHSVPNSQFRRALVVVVRGGNHVLHVLFHRARPWYRQSREWVTINTSSSLYLFEESWPKYGNWLCRLLCIFPAVKQSHDYGSVGGIGISHNGLPGYETEAQKVWNVFIALGNIAFAYSYSMILIEIQVYPSTCCQLKARFDISRRLLTPACSCSCTLVIRLLLVSVACFYVALSSSKCKSDTIVWSGVLLRFVINIWSPRRMFWE